MKPKPKPKPKLDARRGVRVSDSLRSCRQRAGLSQHALAQAVGIERTNYLRYERAAALHSLTLAVALADALQCSLDELVGRTPPATPKGAPDA